MHRTPSEKGPSPQRGSTTIMEQSHILSTNWRLYSTRYAENVALRSVVRCRCSQITTRLQVNRSVRPKCSVTPDGTCPATSMDVVLFPSRSSQPCDTSNAPGLTPSGDSRRISPGGGRTYVWPAPSPGDLLLSSCSLCAISTELTTLVGLCIGLAELRIFVICKNKRHGTVGQLTQ